jgi:hypothetical protein
VYLSLHLYVFLMIVLLDSSSPLPQACLFQGTGLGSKAWIDTTTDLVCEEFRRSYASKDVDDDTDDDNDDDDSKGLVDKVRLFFWSSFVSDPLSSAVFRPLNNIFDNLPTLAPTLSDICDELEHYLSTDTKDVQDGLLWWHDRHAAYPCLSCMA